VRISDAAGGLAYAAAVGLALCAARHVFIDGAHMDPSLVEGWVDNRRCSKGEGVRVAVATQSIEAVDALARLELDGTVLRLRDCAIHDELPLQEARERLDALHDDLKY